MSNQRTVEHLTMTNLYVIFSSSSIFTEQHWEVYTVKPSTGLINQATMND
jgi:hypothetical protein